MCSEIEVGIAQNVNIDNKDNMSKFKMALLAKKQKQVWNQKTAIKQFLSNYNIQFEMEADAMDLRTMAKNYTASNEIIPLEDIHQGLMAILGPNYDPSNQPPYDPSLGIPLFPFATMGTTAPQFSYVNWDELYLFSIFQRDVAANHCKKLRSDWDHTSVLIPCAIKFTIKGKVYYCIWDGHHTLQTARMMNYTKYPIWYIDIDAVPMTAIVSAGFTPDEAGKVKYGCWIAGHNMIRINATNKRPLSHYDRFMILLETNDAKSVSMYRIITGTGCVVKRNAKIPGSWTQINSGEECYDLMLGNGQESKGIFWRRALEFHRRVWPNAPLVLEIFRPFSYMYQAFDVGNYTIDSQFDTEMENIIVNKYGDPESAHAMIKESYEQAVVNNLGRGRLLKNDREIVTNGLLNLYNQNCGRLAVIPQADYVWSV